MFKIAVIDDEDWVRERLMYTLDWESLGITVVGEASNGVEALELIERTRPHIVLTDISMPGISGLELIAFMKERQLHAKSIIISGYSDFEYAKQAVALGAFDYILKPVEDEMLLDIVARCLEQIKIEQSHADKLRQAEEKASKRLPLLKELFFSRLVQDETLPSVEAAEALHELQIDNAGLSHRALVIELDVRTSAEIASQSDEVFIRFVIQNIAQDLIMPVSRNHILFSHSGQLVAIISTTEAENILEQSLLYISAQIRHIVQRILGCPAIIGIGEPVDDILKIRLSYRQARNALLRDSYLPANVVPGSAAASVNYKPNEQKPAPSISLESPVSNLSSAAFLPASSSAAFQVSARSGPLRARMESYKRSDTAPLLEAILIGDYPAAREQLLQIVQHNAALQAIELKFIYITLVNYIGKSVLRGQKLVADFLQYSMQFLGILQQTDKVEEIHPLLEKGIENIIQYLQMTKRKKTHRAIEATLQHIESHYREPLTLTMVAELLFLNASYLSKIFSEEMGISFSKYVMQYRIAKAIELMSDNTLKIYEIAARVGYEDVQYFTKIFKSITGFSPMQYREKQLH